MSRHEQLMQMFNQTQWWTELNDKQKSKMESYITWARNTIRSNEGCLWMASIFRRAAIFLSVDPPGSGDTGKWARAKASLRSQGYDLDKVIEDICSIVTLRGGGQGTSQLQAVFNNLRQKADRLEAANIDVKKLNPKVIRLLIGGVPEGGGHSQDCPATQGGHCKCGWRDVERRAMELAPLRMPLAVAFGLEKIHWKDESGRDNSFNEVYTEINNIGSNLDSIHKIPEGHTLVNVGPDSKWVRTDCHGDENEGKLMGHCGNQGGNREDTMLSYRVNSDRFPGFFEPRLTFILGKNGLLGEMKGRNNDKPEKEYHPAIIALLKNDLIKGVSGHGYRPANNFSLNDLSDEAFLDLYAARPDVVKSALRASDSYQKLSSEKLRLIQNPEARPRRAGQASSEEVNDLEGEDHELPE